MSDVAGSGEDSWSIAGDVPTRLGGLDAATPVDAAAVRHVGRYVVLAPLGRGAQGTVFRARDPVMGREVALKLLAPAFKAQGSVDDLTRWRERFRREAEVTAALRHPGIVAVHDAGEVAGTPFIAYELVEGCRTLGHAMPRLARPDRLEILRQVAAALAHAHARGAVHRDVKPHNVLLDAAGRARLADFGLVQRVGAERLTLTGAMVGTPAYMAPEQLEGRRDDVGPAADVWALGVMLHVALVDELPFEAAGLFELRERVLEGPRSVRARDRTISRALDALCARCLDVDPRRRPRAEEVARALAAARDEAARPRGRRGVLLATAAAGTLGVLGAGLGLHVLGPSRAPAPAAEASPGPALDVPSPPSPAPASSEAPAPEASPAPARGLPAVCASYHQTARARLAAVLGEHGGKHEGLVNAVVFAPDGLVAGSVSEDGTARVWDLARGDEVLRLEGAGAPLKTLCFSRNGARVVTGSNDGLVRVHDRRSGALERALPVDGGSAVLALEALPDGRVLAGLSDGSVRSCDLEAGEVVTTFTAHAGGVWSIAASADGAWCVTCGEDRASRAWDVASGRQLSVLPGHDGAVLRVALGPGAWPQAAAVDTAGGLRVWDVMEGRLLMSARAVRPEQTRGQGYARGVAFTPDGARVLTGGDDDVVRTWDLRSGREVAAPLAGHRGWINSLALSADGTRLLTGSNDQTVRLWDLSRGVELWPRRGHASHVRSVWVGRDLIVSASWDGTVLLWRRDDLDGSPRAIVTDGPGAAVLSPGGDRLLVAVAGRRLSVHEVASGREVGRSRVLRTAFHTALWLSVDGGEPRPVTVGVDGLLVVWEATADEVTPARTQPLGSRGDTAACAAGDLLVVGGRTGAVDAVDLRDGVARPLAALDAPITALAPAGAARVLAGAASGALAVIDVAAGETVTVHPVDGGPVVALAGSPDGRLALLASADRCVRLIDLDAGREVDRIDLTSSGDRPLAVAFAPDGRSFAVGTSVGVVLSFALR